MIALCTRLHANFVLYSDQGNLHQSFEPSSPSASSQPHVVATMTWKRSFVESYMRAPQPQMHLLLLLQLARSRQPAARCHKWRALT